MRTWSNKKRYAQKKKLFDEICRLSLTISNEDISKMLRIPEWVTIAILRKYNSEALDIFIDSMITDELNKQISKNLITSKDVDLSKREERERLQKLYDEGLERKRLELERFDNNLTVLYNKTGNEYMTLKAIQKYLNISANKLQSHIKRLKLSRKHPSNYDKNKLEKIAERDLEIINKWLNNKKLTLQALGDEFGVSRERIRQIIKDARVHRIKEPKLTQEEYEQRKLDNKACKIAGNFTKFWDKVRITNYCWEWTGYTHPKSGYGILNLRFIARDERYTHRISWILKNGKIPNGLHVLHKCDNRICVRPEHLYLGTQTDNNRDRDERYAGISIWSKRKGIDVPRRKVVAKE